MAELEAGLEDALGGGGGVGDLAAILRGDGHGLFAVHVLADFERGDGHLLVEVDGRGDDDRVDIFPVEELTIFGVGVGRVAGGGGGIDRGLESRRVDIANGDYFDAWYLQHISQQVRASVANSDEADADRIVRRLSGEKGGGGERGRGG